MTTQSSTLKVKGRSYSGQNLSGANFSGADIRGINFADANLHGANFVQTTAGVPLKWTFLFLVGILLTSFMVGYITGYSSTILSYINSLMIEEESFDRKLLSVTISLTLFTFLGLTARHGLGSGIGTFAVMVAGLVTITAALGSSDITAASIVAALFIAGAIAALTWGAVTTTISLMLLTKKAIGFSIVAFALTVGAVPGILEGIGFLDNLSGQYLVQDFISSCLIALVLIGFTLWAGWQSFCKNPKYRLSHAISLWLVTSRATRFRAADLTDADFTQAKLHNVDLRQAVLNRTNWLYTSGLDQARVDRTYLEHPQILKLVTSGNGQDKRFEHLDLRGVNLYQANLADASFMGANLSEANLEGANLSRANLVRTQLYRTNLSRSCLTGAYIQNWGISIETQLDEVACDYTYMRLPTKEEPDPCRKPDNHKETFKPGEFADFIAPILKTLDLYQQQNVDLRAVATTYRTIDLFHHQGIDPSAAAIALQQLAEQHPEAGIEIIALEGRGNENIRLQAKVTAESNRSALSADYFERYSQLKTLSYIDLQALLAGVAEKDTQICQLSEMLEAAIQQPKFYVETYQHHGELIMSQSKGNIRIGDIQGNVSGIAAAGEHQIMTGVAIGVISGSVTNTINQLSSSSDPDIPSIKELLTQLQEAIEAEAELPNEDKAEALEQVKTLAEAGQKPEDHVLQKAAKTSMKILKGTVASLPDAAQLAEACAKLLPAITTLLALV